MKEVASSVFVVPQSQDVSLRSRFLRGSYSGSFRSLCEGMAVGTGPACRNIGGPPAV